jgi:hypothetical protein
MFSRLNQHRAATRARTGDDVRDAVAHGEAAVQINAMVSRGLED